MPVLYRASFGYLLRHPWQLALALLGICTGVAVMVAIDLATESSRNAFLLSMDAVNGTATHQIVAGPGGIDEEFYVSLRVDEGMRAIAPVVEGFVETGGMVLRLLGIDPFAEREMRAYRGSDAFDAESGVTTLRRLMSEPGGLLLTPDNAAALGLHTGDTFEVVAAGKRYAATFAGTLPDEVKFTDIALADISTAQEWLDMRGHLSRIDVRNTEDEPIAERIRARLPPGLQLLSAAGRTRSVAEMSNAFMTNLTAMSLLAMLVGIFLIYNSVSFAVLQRRGLIGVLRALGLTRQQVFGLILGEGIALGIVGASLGVFLGIWLGEQLLFLVSQSINDLYFRVTVTEVAVSPVSVARGFAAGLGATVVAAAVPAIEAASYAPRLAIARSVLESRTGNLLPAISLLGLAAVLFAAGLLQFAGNSLIAGLVALFLLILGCALCIPIAVRFASTHSAGLAGRMGGVSARLAVSGIAASLSRTGVAIVALAVAISATIGVSVMVDSFRASVSEWLEHTLQSDIYVAVPGGHLDKTLLADLLALPGIATYSTRRRVWIESEAGRTQIIVLSMAPGVRSGTRLLDAEPAVAWRLFEQESAVLVSEPYGYRNQVGRGDVLELSTHFGRQAFRIAGTYESYDATGGAILMSRRTYDANWRDDAVDSVGLYLHNNATVSSVIDSLQQLSKGRQAIMVRSNRQLKELSMQIFDRTFVITDVLYWLAVGVASVGILGAMMALQLERSRELAVLRSLGMTPLQLGAMVVFQSGCIGLLSGLAAIPLGLAMAAVLVDVINRRAFGWQLGLEVDPAILGVAVLLAITAALLGGLYPAWHAARAQPALAMREE